MVFDTLELGFGVMKGVARALHILELVADDGPIGVSELSRRVAMPKSTVQRSLLALAEAGWIRPVGDDYKRWVLTPRALVVGQRGSTEGSIADIARPLMTALRNAVDETITLQVRSSSTETVHIDSVESTQPVRAVIQLGLTSHLTVTSGGLSILAHMGEDERESVLSQPIPRVTPRTVTDVAEVRLMLDEVRERGYAVNQGQNRLGICAVGTAILDSYGYPIAAVGISVPESRFAGDRIVELGTEVLATSKAIAERASGAR